MKIDISQQQTLEFLIEVDGTNIDEVKSRLLLTENNLMIGVDGTTDVQSDGQAKLVFTIPELKGIIKSSEVGAKIEMFVENKFYVPYETTIEIERPVVFKVNEGKTGANNKSPFSVKDAKIIKEKKEKVKADERQPEPELLKETPQHKTVEENSFNLNSILSDFESSGNFVDLKESTISAIRNNPVFENLSDDSKEKISVLNSKRVKTEELYFKIMEGVLQEMVELGVNVILD